MANSKKDLWNSLISTAKSVKVPDVEDDGASGTGDESPWPPRVPVEGPFVKDSMIARCLSLEFDNTGAISSSLDESNTSDYNSQEEDVPRLVNGGSAGSGGAKRRKGSGSPFSSRGYVKRRKRRRNLPVSRLATSSASMPSSDVDVNVKGMENVQNTFVQDEFEPQKDLKDMGKGKRRRFQNVRMMPIDEIIDKRTSSPNRAPSPKRTQHAATLPSPKPFATLNVRSVKRRKHEEELSIAKELELINGRKTLPEIKQGNQKTSGKVSKAARSEPRKRRSHVIGVDDEISFKIS